MKRQTGARYEIAIDGTPRAGALNLIWARDQGRLSWQGDETAVQHPALR
jgi:hypothetical protein